MKTLVLLIGLLSVGCSSEFAVGKGTTNFGAKDGATRLHEAQLGGDGGAGAGAAGASGGSGSSGSTGK